MCVCGGGQGGREAERKSRRETKKGIAWGGVREKEREADRQETSKVRLSMCGYVGREVLILIFLFLLL